MCFHLFHSLNHSFQTVYLQVQRSLRLHDFAITIRNYLHSTLNFVVWRSCEVLMVVDVARLTERSIFERPLSSKPVSSTNHRSTDHFHFSTFTKKIFYRRRISRELPERINRNKTVFLINNRVINIREVFGKSGKSCQLLT